VTLLLAAINADYAVLVSDRRLTQSGHALPDEANKTAHLVLNDGRFGVAYTGLATDGSHSTSRWLLEALLEAAAPDALTSQTLERLGQVAERDIGALGRVGTPDGRLSIMLAGFTYPKDEPRAVACLVSNYDSFGRGSNQAASREFTPHYLAERRPREEDMSLVAFAGAEMAISDRDGQALVPLLKKRRPAHATAVKAFDLVREIAGRPRSSGLIGLQLMAVIVPSDPEVAASSLYDVSVAGDRLFGPSLVDARGGDYGRLAIMDPGQWTTDGSGAPVRTVLPRVGRNAPCPCGSGAKFKRCHGAGRGDGGPGFTLGG
jgi:hypothetical protein